VTLFPFAAFLPAIAAAVLLGALWSVGELGLRALWLLAGWFLIAAYAQFFTASTLASLTGLLAQTALAVYLVFRWKLAD
jgi:hypothetical protein